jgi:lipopolysaccharide/colanic/teichoic acid biosynthesis glycosyltransferase
VSNSFRKAMAPLSLLELAACEIAFASFAVPAIYAGPSPGGTALGTGITALAFWWGFQWGTPQSGTNVLQPAFVGIGMALLMESLMVYTELSVPMSLLSLVGGCLGATLLAVVLRKWLLPQSTDGRVLLLGCGAVTSSVVTALGPQLMGILERDSARVPPQVAYLGGFPALSEVVAACQPTDLMLDLPDWDQHFSPRFLLDCKLEGRRMETSATAYERFFQRISVSEYQPFHYWQEMLRSNRRIMALQAIYSNLSGLILLVGLSPVLVLLGLAARLAAGSGPVFESVACAGFQKIPFGRRRFRIHHAVTGDTTGIGKVISRLRLTNLPQVINLVRGEIGLFGPEPVRVEFATYLEELSPIYSHRFSMKPGVFGWAQANAGRGEPSRPVQEESVRIGYDLYYLEYGSPFVDLEILLRTLARSTAAWKQ